MDDSMSAAIGAVLDAAAKAGAVPGAVAIVVDRDGTRASRPADPPARTAKVPTQDRRAVPHRVDDEGARERRRAAADASRAG